MFFVFHLLLFVLRASARVTFDDKGMSNDGNFTTQMQNGKVVVIWPEKNATGKFQWPNSAWK